MASTTRHKVTDTTNVELIGFDELASALEGADRLFMPLASKAMAISLTAIESIIAPYPPQPARDRAAHFNTYVRGQGNYPKSAFVADSSEPGGYRTKRVPKASIRLTSQQMDKRFSKSVKVKENILQGELRNEATYSGYVIGPVEGDPHQVSFHAQTGWVNADDAIAQATPDIVESLNTAIGLFLHQLAGT